MSKNGVSKEIEIGSKKIIKEMNNISNAAEKADKSISSLGKSVAKLFSAQKITSFVTQGIKKAVDYVEDLNLLKVAFGDTADAAYDLSKSIAAITGFDESTLVRNLATFRNLTSTLGATNEVADLLATNLEKMSLDISSLYNVDVNRAAYALQGMLTGQPRSIKSITGANVTNAALQEELANRGIDLKVNQLNRAEKAILQYLTVEKQLINSNGDLARTLEQPANQLKVFRDQISKAARSIGTLLLPVLQAVLPYLTAMLMVFNEIASAIAGFFGIDADKFWKDMASGSQQAAVNFDNIEKSVNKAKGGLRAFDRLNAIKSPSSDQNTGGLGGLGINSDILLGLKEYNLKLQNIQTKAAKIRDNIMSWLGFSKEIDEKTGKISFKFEKITSGTIFGGLIAGGAIFVGIKSIFNIFKKITGLKFTSLANLFGKNGTLATGLKAITSFISGLNPMILLIAGTIATVVALAVKLYNENDRFREKVNKFFNTMITTFKPFIEDFLDTAKKLITSIWDILKQLYNDVLKPLIDLLAKILKPIFEFLMDWFEFLFTKVIAPLEPVFKWIIDTFLAIVVKAIENIIKGLENVIKVLTWLWDNILEPLWTNLIKPLIDNIVNGIKMFIIPAIETIGAVVNTIKNAIQGVVDWWNGLSFNKKNIKVDYQTSGGGGTGSFGGGGSMGFRAEGGFVKSGEIYMANENGASEFIGRVGNKTAVANNDQIVEAVSRGVANAIISTGGLNSKPVVIQATGDASGLMNFINFKQKENDMQYGN